MPKKTIYALWMTLLFSSCAKGLLIEPSNSGTLLIPEGKAYVHGRVSDNGLKIISPEDGSSVALTYKATIHCIADAAIQIWDASLSDNGQSFVCPSSGELNTSLTHDLAGSNWRGFTVTQTSSAGFETVNVTLQIDSSLPVTKSKIQNSKISKRARGLEQVFSVNSPVMGSTIFKNSDLSVNCESGAIVQLWSDALVNNGQSFVCPSSGHLSASIEYNTNASIADELTIEHHGSSGDQSMKISYSVNVTVAPSPTNVPTSSPAPTVTPTPTAVASVTPTPTVTSTPTQTPTPSPSPTSTPIPQTFSLIGPAQNSTTPPQFNLAITCVSGASVTLWNGYLVNNGQTHTCPESGEMLIPLEYSISVALWNGVSIQHTSTALGMEQINLVLYMDPAASPLPTPTPSPSPTPTATPTLPPTTGCDVSSTPEIWGLMGQSNAVGLPRDNVVYPTLAANVAKEYKMNGDSLVALADPLGDFIGPNFSNGFGCLSGSDNHSLGYPFAKRYHEITGHQVIMVHAAQGGTSLLTEYDLGAGAWIDTAQCIYPSAIEKVNRAITKSGATYKGTIWYQGETDSVNGSLSHEVYKDGLRTFINRIYSDTNAPVYSINPGYMCAPNTCPHDPGVESIKAAQEELAIEPLMMGKFYVVYDVTQLRQYGTTYYIDKEGDSYVHLNSAGLDLVGNAAAEEIARKKGCQF